MSRRRLTVAGAIVVATLVVVLTVVAFSRGPSQPKRVAAWYDGTWRVSGPMVGVVQGHLVQRHDAPAGVVVVREQAGHTMVCLRGFPGVSPTTVSGKVDPLQLNITTPCTDGQRISWTMNLSSKGTGFLEAYDPGTDLFSGDIRLTRE